MNTPQTPVAADPPGAGLPNDGLQRALLQTWFSPAFPIGGFAYSHGLEFAVETGSICNRESLQMWLGDLLRYGSARTDAAIIAAVWRAMRRESAQTVDEIAEFSAALQPSAERYLEATTLGRCFMDAIAAAWPAPGLAIASNIDPITCPVATGIATAAHGLDLAPVLDAYILAFISNLTSAAIRLGVIGHTDSQRIIAALLLEIEAAAAAAREAMLDTIGACTFAADLASILHETQYTRLFRT